jgi:hypothetical protein
VWGGTDHQGKGLRECDCEGLAFPPHSGMPAPSYEFHSFAAAAERQPALRASARGAGSSSDRPWLPNGPGTQHQRTKGIPSQHDRLSKSAAADLARLNSACDSAEETMERLDQRLDHVISTFEAHVLSATAASVLINKRLAMLGLATTN